MIRFFDLIISSISLVFLSPLFILISFALKLTGEGEVFYVQKRRGISGKTFSLYKFATMLKNSPNIGTGTLTIKNDSRILPLGKFLRKSKINELPQLLNIFLGEMSLVGPRPLTYENFNLYSKEIKKIIISQKPGLTGIGSIVFRDEESLLLSNNKPLSYYKNIISPYKGNLEVWYVKNKSLFIYFSIIIVTILVTLWPRSKFYGRLYKNLPRPPRELQKLLFV